MSDEAIVAIVAMLLSFGFCAWAIWVNESERNEE
jgi:hypothetical protein